FEDLFLIYSPSAVEQYSISSEELNSTEENVLIFDHHINDFFEYMIEKRPQNSQYDMLYEVKQYLDKHLVPKAINNFLSVPATSVVSEQMFSYASYIIDNDRTLLDSSTITALIC
ncbi:10516_t:CDS:2, partial [Scutellospora calospora]